MEAADMTQAEQAQSPTGESDMTPEQAARHLKAIRELMERPIRQTTRSGLAGGIAGALALAGCAVTGVIWPARPDGPPESLVFSNTRFSGIQDGDTILAAGLTWLAVLVIAATADVVITWARARRRGETYWKRAQFQTGLAILPGFVLAAFFTYMFGAWNEYGLIPFGWMIGYGMALWTVGMFSITEVKVLGGAFLAVGWLGMILLPGSPIVLLAVTFGGFHLVYGAVVWVRHGG